MNLSESILGVETQNVILPREKGLALGIESLNDLELLQLVLGSGTKAMPVRTLAAKVLEYLDNHPEGPQLEELKALPGIGEAKASSLCAALELSRRLYNPRKLRIRSPQDGWRELRHFGDRQQEAFYCILLNGAHEVIRVETISLGLINRTLVHPREVFAQALKKRAVSIMIAHNHPSGNLEPSKEDLETTKRLCAAGVLLGISVLDHIIFNHEAYFSFVETGLLDQNE